MNWFFTLNDRDGEEPIGWDEVELSLQRDDTYHGMTFEAATSVLQFYGADAAYLKEQKKQYGVRALVIFSAYVSCGTYDVEKILSGRLNFGKYRESCGNECIVSIPWEQESCAVTLNARFDQKVDIDKITATDGITPMPFYNGLGLPFEIPAQRLFVSTEGYVQDAGDPIDLSIFAPGTSDFWVRPTYSRKIYESIVESQLEPSVWAAADNGVNDSVLSPVLLLDDTIPCFDGIFEYEVRLKGSFNYDYNVGQIMQLRGVVAYGEFPDSLTVLDTVNITPFQVPPMIGVFDFTVSGNVTLPQGQGFYVYLFSDTSLFSATPIGNITFDKETYVNVTGAKECPASEAELYMVHETLSRAAESITNGCAVVKSQYYGRTDSQPYSFPTDGCGGLRTLTSGLKIRKAEEDNFFVSFKELIEGLNAIDNIGYDVIEEELKTVVRIEAVDFFYQDVELLQHDYIPKADKEVEELKHYSKINVGYKKWEVESVNGLGEYNSNRQYNTDIDTINSTLEITSNLVAGTFAIEITRQQSFAESGGADTSYDNETFIIAMRRTTYPYGSIEVEQGNIDSPENIFSPETALNFRLTPVRNLMRWYKSIQQGQLYFTSGTGNLTAAGMLDEATCRLENGVIRENQNIFVTNFQDPADATPIWENELATYEYSMSVEEYRVVKANPYGYISLQCGHGEYEKAFIKELKYRPARGTATFILRKKYGNGN